MTTPDPTTPDAPVTTDMTVDTDPDNPVNALPENMFPIGAALTIVYGGPDRYFATLGNVYRVLGYLTGEVPLADDIPDAMQRCRYHVENQLPTDMRIIDPPPIDTGDNIADIAWIGGIVNKYGPYIRLVALPGTINNPTPTDETPTDATEEDTDADA